MRSYKYPSDVLISVKASELDYLRNVKRTTVSVIEAAHLVCEILPKIDSALAFLNPDLIEVYEVYKLLIDAAENGMIRNAEKDNGAFRAPLIDLCGFLISIDHPIPDELLKILDKELKLKKKEIKKSLEIPSTPSPVPTKLDKKREQLHEELKNLDKYFPKIPYRYYFYHRDIATLAKELNLTESNIEYIAGEVIETPRQGGRPPNDILDGYEKAHPKLQYWFKKIKELREEAR